MPSWEAPGPLPPAAALYKLSNKKPGIVVCNIGDAATACGPVWEGMVISSMDQYRTLWGKDGGGMPIIFQYLEQQLRHGRTDQRRDHGISDARPYRSGAESYADAR